MPTWGDVPAATIAAFNDSQKRYRSKKDGTSKSLQPNPFNDERRKFKEAMLQFAKQNIELRNTGIAKDRDGHVKHRYPELSKIVEHRSPARSWPNAGWSTRGLRSRAKASR